MAPRRTGVGPHQWRVLWLVVVCCVADFLFCLAGFSGFVICGFLPVEPQVARVFSFFVVVFCGGGGGGRVYLSSQPTKGPFDFLPWNSTGHEGFGHHLSLDLP